MSADAKDNVGLFLDVQRGVVSARVHEERGSSSRRDAIAEHPAVLPLSKLIAVSSVEELLSGVPFLSGYLIHLTDEGWVWYFSTLAGEGKPRVRASDGAVWPYPRGR